MSREKQIEEMNAEIREAVNGCSSYWSGLIAEHLYEQGYRRQSEREWLFDDGMDRYCSNCGANALTSCFEYKQICTPYCPFCGAKMKGGAE